MLVVKNMDYALNLCNFTSHKDYEFLQLLTSHALNQPNWLYGFNTILVIFLYVRVFQMVHIFLYLDLFKTPRFKGEIFSECKLMYFYRITSTSAKEKYILQNRKVWKRYSRMTTFINWTKFTKYSITSDFQAFSI